MAGEMVERAARAIVLSWREDVWEEMSEDERDDCRFTARAVIEAMREPTAIMLSAGINHPRMKEVGDVLVFAATRGIQIKDEEPWPLQAAYAAMIDAALAD